MKIFKKDNFLIKTWYLAGLFIITLSVSEYSYAQVNPMLGSLFNARILANNAVAPIRGIPSIQIFRRNQWSNFPGSPLSYAIALEVPLTNEFATGLTYSQDASGALSKKKATLIGAYKISLDEDVNDLSFGVGLGLYNQGIDVNKLNDPTKESALKDPNAQNYNGSSLDGDFGVYYNYDSRIGLGIYLPSIKANLIDKAYSKSLDGVWLSTVATALFILDENEEFTAEPSAYVGLTSRYGTYVYLGARATYQNKFSVALMYDIKGGVGYGINFMYNNQFLLSTYQVLNVADAKTVSGSSLEFGLTVFYGETPLLSYD